MRNRAFRRHQAERRMWRRLKEDRNQHYDQLDCPCWTDQRAMADSRSSRSDAVAPAAPIRATMAEIRYKSA
jgi:hypothetical protein